jgi:hypothetical protein
VTDNTDRQCLIHTAVVRNSKLKLLIPFRTFEPLSQQPLWLNTYVIT